MQLTDNRSPQAGGPVGYNASGAMLAPGDGYSSIIPHATDCQNWRRYCFAQVAHYIQLAERWLDISEAAPS